MAVVTQHFFNPVMCDKYKLILQERKLLRQRRGNIGISIHLVKRKNAQKHSFKSSIIPDYLFTS